MELSNRKHILVIRINSYSFWGPHPLDLHSLSGSGGKEGGFPNPPLHSKREDGREWRTGMSAPLLTCMGLLLE
jgi:hypothetical protein